MSAPQIFDEPLMIRRLRRACDAPPGFADFLFAHAATDLVERLGAVARQFDQALGVYNLGGVVVEALRGCDQITALTQIEPSACLLGDTDRDAQVGFYGPPWNFGSAQYDLAVSVISPGFVNDLPGLIAGLGKALRPDGLLTMCVMGPQTLNELRDAFLHAESELGVAATPHVAPFSDVRSVGALAQRAGLALIVCDSESLSVRYPSPMHLLQDLRRMGATNNLCARHRAPLRRAVLERAMEIYTERYANAQGAVVATFEFVWLSGWAPDASQRQPLRRGSATHSLAQAVTSSADNDTF